MRPRRPAGAFPCSYGGIKVGLMLLRSMRTAASCSLGFDKENLGISKGCTAGSSCLGRLKAAPPETKPKGHPVAPAKAGQSGQVTLARSLSTPSLSPWTLVRRASTSAHSLSTFFCRICTHAHARRPRSETAVAGSFPPAPLHAVAMCICARLVSWQRAVLRQMPAVLP